MLREQTAVGVCLSIENIETTFTAYQNSALKNVEVTVIIKRKMQKILPWYSACCAVAYYIAMIVNMYNFDIYQC